MQFFYAECLLVAFKLVMLTAAIFVSTVIFAGLALIKALVFSYAFAWLFLAVCWIAQAIIYLKEHND